MWSIYANKFELKKLTTRVFKRQFLCQNKAKLDWISRSFYDRMILSAFLRQRVVWKDFKRWNKTTKRVSIFDDGIKIVFRWYLCLIYWTYSWDITATIRLNHSLMKQREHFVGLKLCSIIWLWEGFVSNFYWRLILNPMRRFHFLMHFTFLLCFYSRSE